MSPLADLKPFGFDLSLATFFFYVQVFKFIHGETATILPQWCFNKDVALATTFGHHPGSRCRRCCGEGEVDTRLNVEEVSGGKSNEI